MIDRVLKDKIGVYKIINLQDEKVYIGSSNNIYRRLKEHYESFSKNNHDNPYLRKIFNKYKPKDFVYEILAYSDLENQFKLEQFYLDTLLFAKEYRDSNGKDSRFLDLSYNLNPLTQKIFLSPSALFLKSIKMKAHWSIPENKENMSQTKKKFYKDHPEAAEKNRQNWIDYWIQTENRKKKSEEKVKFFQENPEAKEKAIQNFKNVPYYSCPHCGKEFQGKNNSTKHVNSCSLNPNPSYTERQLEINKRIQETLLAKPKTPCQYGCGKEISNKGGLKKHENVCSLNPNPRIITEAEKEISRKISEVQLARPFLTCICGRQSRGGGFTTHQKPCSIYQNSLL